MKRKYCKLAVVILIFSILISNINVIYAENNSADSKIKNIIFMIPDGGGMTAFNMANEVKNKGGFNDGLYPYATPIEKGDMNIKEYWVGAEITRSANSPVTDSAAAGTALATGVKTNNGYVGVDTQAVPIANLLEASQHVGKNTGIVVTYEWTNATPATFSAHDISRSNMTTMSEQIVNQGIDVVLGGTHSAFSDTSWFTDESLEGKGYEIMNTNTELADVKAGDKLWGKFSGNLYYDASSTRTSDIPTLAEMTDAAITALDDDNENGFFLMVEGSAVDGGGHSNHARYMVGDYMAFDAACKVAIDFAKEREDTIVLIAPDHDTGGMYWDEANLSSIVAEIQAGTAKPTNLNWTGTSHTDWHGGIFIYAPEGVSYPDGIDPDKKETALSEFAATGYKVATTNLIDNTGIPKYLAGFIGVDLEELSKELFVDVTDMGEYDSSTEIFSFNSLDVQIKRNESYATYNGEEIDLDGEIALYIENKFYVPTTLISKVMGGATGAVIDVSNNGTYDSTTSIFRFTDYDAYIENASTKLVYKGNPIEMGSMGFYKEGKFFAPSKILQTLERLGSEEWGTMKIVADYNMQKIEASGWVNSPNGSISMLAMPEGTGLTDENIKSNAIALWQTEADYSGDYSATLSVKEEDIGGKYTFYMNYSDSSSETPFQNNFVFQNTIPTMSVENENGDILMYIEQLSEGNKVCVTLSGFDKDDEFNGAVIIAQYNENDVLVKADVLDATGGSVEVGSEIHKSAGVVGGVNKIEVMYWDWSNKCPVFGTYTISSKG